MKRISACIVAWLAFGLWCDLGPDGYSVTTAVVAVLLAVGLFGAVVLDVVDHEGRR